MLVLARKIGEKIIVNDNIEIIVLDANQNTVRIGVNAPKNVTVYREELYREIKTTNKYSCDVTANIMDELHAIMQQRKDIHVTKDRCNMLVNKIAQK